MRVSLGSLGAILGRLRVMQKPAGLRSAGFVLSRGAWAGFRDWTIRSNSILTIY